MKKYQHIEYNGKTLTVNEKPKPEFLPKASPITNKAKYDRWELKHKKIDIAEWQEKALIQYLFDNYETNESDKEVRIALFSKALESGILIDPARVRFESVKKETEAFRDIEGNVLSAFTFVELAYFIPEETEKEETNVARLRNQLTPLYGLANIVLAYDNNTDIKELMVKAAKQAVESQKEIHRLLKLIEG